MSNPVIDKDNIHVVSMATSVLVEIGENLEDNENPYELNIEINAGELSDIIDLLLLLIEKYEFKHLEEMTKEENILQYIDIDGKPN